MIVFLGKPGQPNFSSESIRLIVESILIRLGYSFRGTGQEAIGLRLARVRHNPARVMGEGSRPLMPLLEYGL
jgi:hypothetical protein